MTATPVIIGIVGWKNSGKTTLVARLVRELSGRGLVVSTVKHAHHSFNVDHEGTDTYSHREAGAREVAIVSENRWAIMHELGVDEREPTMTETIARLSPCDIVVAEGYKSETHHKIEIQRADAKDTRPLFESDPNIVAIINPVVPVPDRLTVFGPDNIVEIADFVLERFAPHLKERAAS